MEVDYSHGMDKGQRTQRRSVRLKDQFGRWWGCSIEKSTGDPCTSVNPHGWADPLETPGNYLRVPKHDDGSPIAGEIKVVFDRWISSVKGSNDDWKRLLDVAGKMEYRIYTPEDRKKWPEDPILREHAGPEPYPTVEMLERAKAGDKELLGLVEKEPDVFTPSPPAEDMTYREFVADLRPKGYDMKEIGALWKEHKALVAV